MPMVARFRRKRLNAYRWNGRTVGLEGCFTGASGHQIAMVIYRENGKWQRADVSLASLTRMDGAQIEID